MRNVTLGQIVSFFNGKTRPTSIGKYPVYGGNGIIDYAGDYNSGENTIIIGRVGANCGSVEFSVNKCWVTDNAIGVIVNDGVVPEYIYYALRKKDLNKLSGGSGQPLLTQTILSNLIIDLPELEEQYKIAEDIRMLDKKIELNLSLMDALKEYSKLLFHEWFVNFNFPDNNNKRYKENGGEFYDLDGNTIPQGWHYKKIDDIVDKILDHRGKTPKKLGGEWSEEGITALSAKVVKNGSLVNLDKANKVSRELYEKWMPEKLTEGDIVMTSEAPLGEFYFILIDTEYCLSQRLFAIRAETSEVLPSYLYFELSQPRGLKKILARQSGSTVFGIRQEELRKVKVLVPTLPVQAEFNKLVFPMLKKVRICEKENENLSEIRDLLIKKLIK